MFHPRCTSFGMGGMILSVALVNFAAFEVTASDSAINTTQSINAFSQANPNTRLYLSDERITHVYGKSFSHGESAFESAESFRLNQAAMFGVNANDIVFTNNPEQPIGYLPEIDEYKFTGFNYYQQEQGIEVFRSRMVLLVRNEAGFPLVLASVDLRDLGGFEIDPKADTKVNIAKAQKVGQAQLGRDTELTDTKLVIWAGVDDMVVQPRLAVQYIASTGTATNPQTYEKWLFLVDAETGAILYQEDQILNIDVVGNVSGMATPGFSADTCEIEELMAMPYARVNIVGGNVDFADENGDYVIPHGGAAQVTVESRVWGQWFRVFNEAGADTVLSQNVLPPGPADFVHNQSNSNEFIRAETNGYVQANIVRDFALLANPSYPVIANQTAFPVNVNLNSTCNAFYDFSSINFYRAGGGCANTAFSSVVHHEYGHHLVAVGGSGQGMYGEGLGDVLGVLISDQPLLGVGFQSCAGGIRNADNSLQYPCSGAIHFCGQLLSGCVWETRNELIVTEPDNYREILGFLAVNSILVHNGSGITPQITIDWLTLDDDDDDISNGTPHYNEIAIGFGEHSMDAPPLGLLQFSFPDGLPTLVSPGGGTTVRVEVSTLLENPVADTGVLHVNTGGGFIEIPMEIVEPNVYDAVFPAINCGNDVDYFFSAETTDGNVATAPGIGSFSAFSAVDINILFEDDFESNLGWVVSNAVSDGQWDRGIPVDCNRGDPPADADGSGQCYLTDNSAAGACNSDVDNGSTTLTSPILDASAEGSVISYWRWYSNTFGNSPMQDIFTVQVSSNNGASWVNLEIVGPGGSEVNGGWIQKEFAIADFVEETDQFRIRFIATDSDPQSVVEAGIDLVRILQIVCAPDNPSDINGDGVVNTEDLLLLFGNWGLCADCNDCPGDIDGSCAVNTADLLALFSNWG
ncbi:MAG: hypothetical protein IH984_05725 [Planctomycetes bacterium]|nr:hypothetical protein [Planctomycetota bacterium]